MKSMLIAVCLSVPVLVGCERVVDIDVEEGPERLVVEGRIERHRDDGAVAQSIRLSTTASYFSNESTPAVSGAEVIVNDDEGATYLFAESSSQAGIYENRDMRPEVGRTYTLEIDLEGESYRAVETLLPVAPIDSMYQQIEKVNYVRGRRHSSKDRLSGRPGSRRLLFVGAIRGRRAAGRAGSW